MNLVALQAAYDDSVRYLGSSGYTANLESSIVHQENLLKRFGTAKPVRAVCIGLGDLSRSPAQATSSCDQLHVFLNMLEAFGIPRNTVSVHDPAFNDIDKDFLRSFDLKIPETPEEALNDLICREPTLVFLPFLPFWVVELFFTQNWRPDLLANAVIVGNSFRGWLDNPDLSMDTAYIPRLERCLYLLESQDMPQVLHPDMPGEGADESQSDLCVAMKIRASHLNMFQFQWLPPYRLHAAGAAFWDVTHLDHLERWVKPAMVKAKL